MAESTTVESVRSLELVVTQHEAAIQQAEGKLAKIQRRLVSLNGSLAFLKLAKSVRQFVDGTIVWRPGAILILATAMGGIGVAVFRSPALGVVGGILAVVAMVFVLLYPSDAKSTENVGRLNAEQAELKSNLSGIATRHREMKTVWQTASDKLKTERLALEREQLAASHEHRRKILLAENWKALRAVEFEAFLERVFTELGYKVETTKVTGDQGVDLVVGHRGKRIAIQVKGYLNSVSNGAVQEAHTGMAYYKCDAAAVITNSRFTPSALDLANNIGCKLVDEDSLPKLILGQVDLWSMCFEGK